ncbi:MAG: hypothetical protein NVS3B16_09870 [Vulcanimicrobiaceae bacterium]
MKLWLTSLLTLTIAAEAVSAKSADPALRTHDYCAGSPLTIGSAFSGGGRIRDIAVVTEGSDVPVGWVYTDSLGKRTIQANARMSAEHQAALKLRAHSAVSNLHPRPATLPEGLAVRRCRASEIARY